jgi:Icc-related predicted phosphoesterase
MLISAVSDLAALRGNFEPFWGALQNAKKPDLLLVAGNISDAHRPEQWQTFLDYLDRKHWDCQVVAVWGAKEFDSDREAIRARCGKRVIFLDDEMLLLTIEGRSVGIVGTKGCLDTPTAWQKRSVQGIEQIYQKRLEKVSGLLSTVGALGAEVKILLSHYAPTYKTINAPKDMLGSLGSERFETVIANTKPTIVIHGHAIYGTPTALLDSTAVYNVAWPVNKKIVEIDTATPPTGGLRAFV